MKKVNVIRLMLVVAIFALVCCVSNVNLATTPDVNDIIHDIQTLPENNVPEQNTNTNVPANLIPLGTNTNSNTSTNTVLPKTGVDDTMMWVLIAVSAVAAIYTYKKVRDYEV